MIHIENEVYQWFGEKIYDAIDNVEIEPEKYTGFGREYISTSGEIEYPFFIEHEDRDGSIINLLAVIKYYVQAIIDYDRGSYEDHPWTEMSDIELTTCKFRLIDELGNSVDSDFSIEALMELVK
jgi:hypothetical protein